MIRLALYLYWRIYVKPILWPFCQVKSCWGLRSAIGGVPTSLCKPHAEMKLIESFARFAEGWEDEITQDYYPDEQ